MLLALLFALKVFAQDTQISVIKLRQMLPDAPESGKCSITVNDSNSKKDGYEIKFGDIDSPMRKIKSFDPKRSSRGKNVGSSSPLKDDILMMLSDGSIRVLTDEDAENDLTLYYDKGKQQITGIAYLKKRFSKEKSRGTESSVFTTTVVEHFFCGDVPKRIREKYESALPAENIVPAKSSNAAD